MGFQLLTHRGKSLVDRKPLLLSSGCACLGAWLLLVLFLSNSVVVYYSYKGDLTAGRRPLLVCVEREFVVRPHDASLL